VITGRRGALVIAACAGVLVLMATGCGGGGSSSTAAETTTATTETTTTETTTTETTPTTSTESTTTPTTTESTTSSTTETSATPSFATAANCKQFAEIGAKLSGAFTGSAPDVEKTKQYFDQLVAAAPSEIKGDFQTIADAWSKIADALKGVDLSSSQTPSAGTLAKLAKLGTELDQAKLTQASTNIGAWAAKNCGVNP
jgi:hypothetical protein